MGRYCEKKLPSLENVVPDLTHVYSRSVGIQWKKVNDINVNYRVSVFVRRNTKLRIWFETYGLNQPATNVSYLKPGKMYGVRVTPVLNYNDKDYPGVPSDVRNFRTKCEGMYKNYSIFIRFTRDKLIVF